MSEGARNSTYVACLDCGRELDYNWRDMRVGEPVRAAGAATAATQSSFKVAH